MPRRLTAAALLTTATVAVLAFMPRREAPAPDLSELFDPAAIARSICGAGNTYSPVIPRAMAQVTILPAADAPPPPLLSGLGTYSFKVTAAKPEAQAYFDQGLRLAYAFNFGESIAAFRAAERIDPTCAMCFWGEAFALGPNLNGGMADDANPLAIAALKKAQELSTQASPRERALISALNERYAADSSKKRADLDKAYAEAMAKAYGAHKNDADVGLLYAAAVMTDRGEWWEKGEPTARFAPALTALEDVLKLDSDHAGAIHYYIHATSDSVAAKKAEPYADKLGTLMPGAGHMVHMPAHTYYRIGRYKDALDVNIAAVAADEAYLPTTTNANVGYRYYLYVHNLHFALASADMAGDGPAALSLAARMEDFMSGNMAGTIDRGEIYKAAAIYAYARFATPSAILALEKPEDSEPYLTGIWRYARGSAYAHQGDAARALAEADAISELRTKEKTKALEKSFWAGPHVLELAEHVVRGRIAAALSKWPEAIEHFEKAVKLQSDLHGYDPPTWDFPVRQSLGVALLRAGKPKEATDVLRQALMDAPHNGFALYALREAAVAAGDATGAAEYGKLFENAWAGRNPPELSRF